MKRAILLVATFAALMLTACRESDAELLADACTKIGEMEQAMAALEGLGPTSTVDQVQEAANNARDQAREAAQAVRRVEEQRYEELADAQSDLAEAVRNLDGDETVVQARAQLQPYVLAVLAARQNLTASLNCP
jgi:hypothetical protein